MSKFVDVKHGKKKICPKCGWGWDEIEVRECPVCNTSILDIMMATPGLKHLLRVASFFSSGLRLKIVSRISSQISIG